MTVIVGLMCSDGAILASDSQGTDIEARVRYEVGSKIFVLGSHIVWGLSGAMGLAQVLKGSLDEAVKRSWPQKTLSQIRITLVDKVTGRQREAVRQYVPLDDRPPPSAEFLCCGCTADQWLLEISERGDHQQHGEFCAIGSGKTTAYHCWKNLQHYAPCQDTVESGKVLVYRIVSEVIETDFVFVGFPVRIWTVTSDGAKSLPAAEIDALGKLVSAWKDEEKHSLKSVLEGRAASARPPGD